MLTSKKMKFLMKTKNNLETEVEDGRGISHHMKILHLIAKITKKLQINCLQDNPENDQVSEYNHPRSDNSETLRIRVFDFLL